MAEVYPADDVLLNVLNDSETGVEYIATGTAPYYLHFRKLLHRLLLACRRGNDLRVYDEDGLAMASTAVSPAAIFPPRRHESQRAITIGV